jgi:solute carrier family 35 protein F5
MRQNKGLTDSDNLLYLSTRRRKGRVRRSNIIKARAESTMKVLKGAWAFLRRTGRWGFGVFLILLVVLIWVSASVLMQYIFTEQHFDHPFFLTYYSTSLFTLYLLDFLRDLPCFHKGTTTDETPVEMPESKPNGQQLAENHTQDDDQLAEGQVKRRLLATEAEIITDKMESKSEDLESEISDGKEKSLEQPLEPMVPMSLRDTARTALIFCPIWFAANYSFNLSLSMTSVSSNTVLSSTSGLSTLILGTLLRVDSFSYGKLVAVGLSLGGVAVVSFTDTQDEGKDSLIGDMLSLLGAVFYAVYLVLLKKIVKDESRMNARRFFGLVGLFNMFLLWPFAIILNFSGFEPFVFPTGMVWLYLTINGLIGTVLSDYLWLWSVLLTTPLVATIGLSLNIPLAMLADIVIKHKEFTVVYVLGSIMVLVGFVLVNADDYVKQWTEKAKIFIVSKWNERFIVKVEVN